MDTTSTIVFLVGENTWEGKEGVGVQEAARVLRGGSSQKAAEVVERMTSVTNTMLCTHGSTCQAAGAVVIRPSTITALALDTTYYVESYLIAFNETMEKMRSAALHVVCTGPPHTLHHMHCRALAK
jgi:hypothetical protein